MEPQNICIVTLSDRSAQCPFYKGACICHWQDQSFWQLYGKDPYRAWSSQLALLEKSYSEILQNLIVQKPCPIQLIVMTESSERKSIKKQFIITGGHAMNPLQTGQWLVAYEKRFRKRWLQASSSCPIYKMNNTSCFFWRLNLKLCSFEVFDSFCKHYCSVFYVFAWTNKMACFPR